MQRSRPLLSQEIANTLSQVGMVCPVRNSPGQIVDLQRVSARLCEIPVVSSLCHTDQHENAARSVLRQYQHSPQSPSVCSARSKTRFLSCVKSPWRVSKRRRRTERSPTCLVFTCSLTLWVSVFQCHMIDECPASAGFQSPNCLSLSVQRASSHSHMRTVSCRI